MFWFIDSTLPRTLRIRPPVLAAVGVLVSLGACNAKTLRPQVSAGPVALPTESQLEAQRAMPAVKALMDKTLKNLRFIEGGSYEMGDFGPKHSEEHLYYTRGDDNKAVHKVTLTSFSMSAYKSSWEDFDVYSAALGQKPLPAFVERMRFPKAAAGVDWYQARGYCQWLGALLKLPMDLPTEAQWEYAARNRGQYFLFATDNGKAEDGRNVWSFEQRERQLDELNLGANPPSLPLGQFPPTPLGLYDMMTDGHEWMLDWYAADYYAHSPELNPPGPAKGTEKVLRGSYGRAGEGLVYGDGMTITRSKRAPNPPLLDKKDPTSRQVSDSTARCVVNLDKPVSAQP